MKLVELDAYVAGKSQLTFEGFDKLTFNGGTVEAIEYDRTSPEETVERCKGAEIVLTNKVIMSDEIMEQLPDLKYIGVMATGYNVVDVEAAHRRGITVTNIPAYSTASVGQMVFAHLLNIALPVQQHSAAVHAGKWQSSPDFSFALTPLIELDGMTIGIVGMGNTGSVTARIANSFGMKVLAYTSKDQSQLPDYVTKAASMDEIFSTADVVSLHCPLTPDTHHLVCERTLSLMKPTAILINTGRGPLVDEDALAKALRENKIYAAGIDVLTTEPPVNGSPLIGISNCHITPHIAWASMAARERLVRIAFDNVQAFLNGKPQNIV